MKPPSRYSRAVTRAAHFLAFAALACAAAHAQAPAQAPAPMPIPQGADLLGKVTEVKGVVTMSFGAQVAMVQRATPVFDTARFIAGSAGKAEITLDNGCKIYLDPNQMITIDGKRSCDALIASIQTLGQSNVGAFAFAGGGGAAILGAALLAGAVVADRVKESEITPRRPN